MKKFWTTDKIVSISAILISLGTFISIIHQNRLIQKQQRASVLPYLEIWNSQDIDRYQLVLMNNGIGPAFIREIRVVVDNKPYPGDVYQFFKNEILSKDTIPSFYYSNVVPGRLIPAGEKIEMIGVNNDSLSARKLSSIFASGKNIKVQIEYESVYGERWLTSGIATEPKKIN
jgi:hypothetical protein